MRSFYDLNISFLSVSEVSKISEVVILSLVIKAVTAAFAKNFELLFMRFCADTHN